MDKLLNIENYLARYFQADQRVADAQLELQKAKQELVSLGKGKVEGVGETARQRVLRSEVWVR